MPSLIYQNTANLIVRFLIWGRPSIFMDVVIWEHRTFDSEVLYVTKFTNLTPLLFLFSQLLFPIVGLKMSSLPTLALKSLDRFFMWYLGNLSNTRSNSS
jgi:hypothetical protein